LAALRHRDATGEGQHIDVSLVDSLLYHSNGNLTSGALGLDQPRLGNQFSIAAPVDNYACKDGVALAGVLLDSHWETLSKLLGREDLSALNIPERLQRRDELNALLAAWCAERTVAEVEETLMAENLIVTKVNSFQDTAKEQHIKDRGMLQNVKMVNGDEAPITTSANKFSRTPTSIRSPAPAIGEHTERILDELGYSPDDKKRLIDSKVV
jgi:crotonobetainyl-CoA:carnitine CoA-transferase CaiB-like acyl-CoA transferase